ncbi:MAG: hypothetical protein ACRDXX_18980 [Stackebrandtia sp.]
MIQPGSALGPLPPTGLTPEEYLLVQEGRQVDSEVAEAKRLRAEAEAEEAARPAGPTDDDLRQEAELARGELGEIVVELRHKLDVKGRALEAAEGKLRRLREGSALMAHRAGGALQPVRRSPVLVGALAAAGALVLFKVLWDRCRR